MSGDQLFGSSSLHPADLHDLARPAADAAIDVVEAVVTRYRAGRADSATRRSQDPGVLARAGPPPVSPSGPFFK